MEVYKLKADNRTFFIMRVIERIMAYDFEKEANQQGYTTKKSMKDFAALSQAFVDGIPRRTLQEANLSEEMIINCMDTELAGLCDKAMYLATGLRTEERSVEQRNLDFVNAEDLVFGAGEYVVVVLEPLYVQDERERAARAIYETCP